MNLTPEQERCVYTRGSNILVSAGAGSGKTAVLTKRTINNLNDFKIEEMIILTFTKAAAFSMKERIRSALKEKSDTKSLKKLDTASICTFDSFSLDLVKKYSYLLNLDSDITITDSVIVSRVKKDIIDRVFLEYYERQEFLDLLDTFTVKDDKQLKNDIASILASLDKKYDPVDYLEHYSTKTDEFILEYVELLDKKYKELKSKYDEMVFVSSEADQKFLDSLETWMNFDSFDDYIKFQEFSVTCRSKNEDLKSKYNEFKELVSEFKELAIYRNKDELREELELAKPYIDVLINLTKDIIIATDEYKKENGLYEFNDISRLAIKLLLENPDIRDYYRNNIKEIMIDEYQDTNDIGDYFISLISNNNVFMVGDVKQSIYRFRNANPSIFIKKYNDYKNGIGGIKIDLNKNFRSNSEVIGNINMIFSKIMSEEIGGANYKEDHIILPNENYPLDDSKNMKILNYDKETYSGFSRATIEAFIIADDIKNKYKSKYQVYDVKLKSYRDFTYSDAAILLASKKEFELYKKVFDYLNIPLTIHKDEDLTYSYELIVIKNIVKLVGYYRGINKDDLLVKTYLSVARSFVFNYSDKEIFEVLVKSKNRNLFDFIDNELKYKITYLSEFIDSHTISELILEILNIFDIYLKIDSLGDKEIIDCKINHLVDIALELDKSNYSLEEFIDYLNDAMDEKIDFSLSSNKDMNTNVNIMSIHKSKGLEFPICYFADLNKKFNIAEIKSRFLFSDFYGFIAPIFKEGIKPIFLKELYKRKYLKEEISERIRQFYVALTRAEEEIIIVTDLDLNVTDLSEESKLKYKSFKDILKSIDLSKYVVEYSKIDISSRYEYFNKKEKVSKEESFETVEIDFIKELLAKVNYSSKNVTLGNELEEGTKIHEYLEYIDFNNIEESLKNIDLSDFLKNKIRVLSKQPFIKENAIYYKEYEFYYNGSLGKMDLLIELDDSLIVVDYKLKEINKEYYFKQVKGYMDYLKTISDKRVEGYLYSILDETYLKVE